MRRYKRNKKNDIIIDLTSLLDVIFIVLLVVMAGQFTASKSQENTLAEQQAEAEAMMEEAENNIAVYENMIDTMDNVNKYIIAVSIAVPYNKEELHKREIKLLAEGNELKSFPLVGSDTEESFNEFKETLEGFIKSNTDSPVILSLNDDDDKILYRDEKAVTEILNELSGKYGNVYIKGNLSEVMP